jgi:hypothetical protein
MPESPSPQRRASACSGPPVPDGPPAARSFLRASSADLGIDEIRLWPPLIEMVGALLERFSRRRRKKICTGRASLGARISLQHFCVDPRRINADWHGNWRQPFCHRTHVRTGTNHRFGAGGPSLTAIVTATSRERCGGRDDGSAEVVGRGPRAAPCLRLVGMGLPGSPRTPRPTGVVSGPQLTALRPDWSE